MIKKALVINDDATSIFIACKLIAKSEFASETITANDGEKALAYFEDIVLSGKEHFDEVPQFIFLDLNMPVMNGWDFLDVYSRKYAGIFPGTKVAVLSASVDPDDIAGLEKYEIVSDFIATPMDLEILKQVKEKFCKNIRAVA